MTVGDRIRRRREELEMSQDELAKRLGYKSRSSINKIERDASGLPQRKIADIAKALQTTPGYIMGWVEKETSKKIDITTDVIYRAIMIYINFIRYHETIIYKKGLFGNENSLERQQAQRL